MIVKSNQHYISAGILFVVVHVIDIIRYVQEPASFVLSNFLFNESVLLAVIIVMFFYWKRKEILFESTDEGINVKGSKQGFYSPSFIRYEDISYCEYERIVIQVHLYDGQVVSLFRLGKNAEKCYNEIMQRIGKDPVNKDE